MIWNNRADFVGEGLGSPCSGQVVLSVGKSDSTDAETMTGYRLRNLVRSLGGGRWTTKAGQGSAGQATGFLRPGLPTA